jgi:hypothetical protein
MDLPFNVEIKTSSIPGAGLGAFAKVNIPKDFVLGNYEGEKVSIHSEGDYVLYMEGYNDNGKFIKMCIDAKDPALSSWARYINGEKDGIPKKNVKFFIRSFRRDGKLASCIGVQATRDIVRGEELITNYGPDYWDSYQSDS